MRSTVDNNSIRYNFRKKIKTVPPRPPTIRAQITHTRVDRNKCSATRVKDDDFQVYGERGWLDAAHGRGGVVRIVVDLENGGAVQCMVHRRRNRIIRRNTTRSAALRCATRTSRDSLLLFRRSVFVNKKQLKREGEGRAAAAGDPVAAAVS